MEDPKGTVGTPQSWDCDGAAVATKSDHTLSLATEGSRLRGGQELSPRQRQPRPAVLEDKATACVFGVWRSQRTRENG